MASITTSISVSRDNVLRYLLEDAFYERNPAFKFLLPDVAVCKAAYFDAKKSGGCNCGGAHTKHMVPCIEKFLDFLLQAKIDDVSVVEKFVEYVNGQPTPAGQQTCVSIYFARAGETNPQRYEFIA